MNWVTDNRLIAVLIRAIDYKVKCNLKNILFLGNF